jgi:hypothetical protein
MNNFINLKHRHENSKAHITSVMALIKFGKTRIDFCLSNVLKLSVQKHNEQVKKNQHILSCLIDATCFLASQELPFRAHDETGDSDNRGNYVELLHLLAKKDGYLSNHLETATVFQGVSSDIQNDLIDSIAEVLNTEISKEVEKAPFVAAIMDETVDISNRSQLSTVLRYVSPNGEVCERFVRFDNVSDDRTAAGLAEHLFGYMNEFKCGNKLVAQTYDGCAVMAGQHNGLQKLVRDKYPSALFVHCYAHKLNLVLKQSVEHIKECKVFFQTVSGFASFFSKSSKRSNALDEMVKRRFPSVSHTRWLYNSRLIELVSSNKVELEELFRSMKDDADEWDGETRACARGFYSILQEFDFNFLLNVFSYALPKSAALFKILQTKLFDINYCLKKICDFQCELKALRDQFDDIWSKTEGYFSEAEVRESVIPKKRQRIDMGDKKLPYRCLFYEIVDTITIQLADRYADFGQLEFLSLLNCEKYGQYVNNFPDSAFNSLKKSYGGYFEFPRLRTELTVIYSSEEFRNQPVFKLMGHLITSGLIEALPEASKLVNLILTIPATSASVERSFSALKRIKTYLRSSQSQNRLSGLALMSIERRLLKSMMQRVTFYDSVIEVFDRKGRRIDLKYK